MKLEEFALKNPAAVVAAALLALLLGFIALKALPIQLLPDTRQPQLFINVGWREAAPNEVEEALVEPIEKAMKGLPGLVEMRANAGRGGGGVNLIFSLGTDMTRVMLDVVSRLNTLPPLPPDADEPQVFGGDNWQGQNAASMLVRPLPGNPNRDAAATYQKLMEEVVEPRLAAVPGVSRVNLEGGRPREVRISFDPQRIAALGITPAQIAATVVGARDASAGFMSVGRRAFTVRFTGKEAVDDLGALIVHWNGDRPLYLRDIAEVGAGFQDARAFTYRNGVPGYYITVNRTSDSNTVELIEGVKAAIAELNAGPLASEQLIMDLSWDASIYVKRALGFVLESLVVGIALVVLGLWYFLRGAKALLVLAFTIPLSLAFAVITLHFLGRTLNVISLAGLAFSTGIVIDAALIVQGNVLRYVQEGMSAIAATLKGTREVIPALVASMLTSIAIFLPVLFMEGLEGQLFKDLAITMSVSHAASLLVAMTVIPAANRWALAGGVGEDRHQSWWQNMTSAAMAVTAKPLARGLLLALMVPGALYFSWAMAPKVDYLPVAPTDNVWGGFRMPPGGNLETFQKEVAPLVIARLQPYYEGKKEPAIKALVMLIIPVSMAGGVAALRLLGLFGFQSLDLLTMIGFIILLGLVVNAAILLVDQTRAAEGEGMPREAALRFALLTRARPIVLSTLTAVLGMAPLIFLPGVGSAVYRGLAAVVAGGMVFGTLAAWFLLPALLRMQLPFTQTAKAQPPSAPASEPQSV